MFSGIWLTQVGDPLCHGTECRSHCVSADRVVGATVAAVSESEDEEVGEASLIVRDITEGRGDAELLAEVVPEPEGAGSRPGGLGGDGVGRESQRNIEVSPELVSGGRCSSFQGRCCGYRCSKWARKEESVRCWRREASSAMMLTSPGR